MKVTDNIFKYALELHLRFPYKGSASVEDLFFLNLEELDSIYKILKKQARALDEEGLITEKEVEDDILFVKMEIVKEIFLDKQAQIERARKRLENKEKEQKLLAILKAKQDAALEGLSEEELKAQIEALQEEI
jgi:hypothetical protein